MAPLERKIVKHLKLREGERLTVYLDSLKKPTVGVGHLVRPEDGLKVGDTITQTQSDAFLRHDIGWALNAAYEQADEMGVTSEDFILALTSVNFQLGPDWKKVFHTSYPKLVSGDWQGAIRGFKASKWAKQTPVRVNDFVKAIEKEYNRPIAAKPVAIQPKGDDMSTENIQPKAGVKTSEFWLTVATGITTFVVTLVNDKFGLGIDPAELIAAISPFLAYITGRKLVKVFN